MQNHYKVLGLTPDVENAVIKAAYRALCKKYHPDRFEGDKEYATELMKKINVAYEVLSDPGKRDEYDKNWGKSDDYQTNDVKEEQYNAGVELENEWGFVVEYYPVLSKLHSNLNQISPPLASAFKILILDLQEFENPISVAKKLESQFLEKYFGSKIAIQETALNYIMSGNREAARELNKAVKIFGSNLDEYVVLSKIKRKFPLEKNTTSSTQDSKQNDTWTTAESEVDIPVFKFVFSLIGVIIFFIILAKVR